MLLSIPIRFIGPQEYEGRQGFQVTDEDGAVTVTFEDGTPVPDAPGYSYTYA
ncbi:MAG TPA: hypothetical protein VN667_14860 [Burkholderiales bacterium]|nr:hypothetical protein [Burkholderiales bacterium]